MRAGQRFATSPIGGILLCAASAAAGYVLRYQFVEPEAMGAACERARLWWCPLRTGFIVFTEWRGLGWLALALAAMALLAASTRHVERARLWAAPTLVAAGFGMILYNATLSAPAAVLATLVLARRR